VGWKFFACLNVLAGACELALLVGGVGEVTTWRVMNDILSVLATVVIVLYAFGTVYFSPGLRKGIVVLLTLFVVVELADVLWTLYRSYTSADAELTPAGAWIFLAILGVINYFTMLAIRRYGRGETLRTSQYKKVVSAV